MRSALMPDRSDVLSPLDRLDVQDGLTVEQEIQWFVERAIKHCGSAAALARELGVKPPTVCQWRAKMKNPDAVNLIRIQHLALQVADVKLSDTEQ